MSSQFSGTKSEIRTDVLQQLNNLSSAQKKSQSSQIEKNLRDFMQRAEGYWGAYRSLSSEPEIHWSFCSEKINWCFPITVGSELQFRNSSTSFKKSRFGISEPQDGTIVPVEKLAGVIVPGLAFSAKGHRLGWGQGYYDRALSAFKGQKIGVCFSLSFTEELPVEAHDILFHQIVTENGLHQVVQVKEELQWN